ncbi:phosphoribosyltransferase [Cellulosimicrobium sp. CUA-896]|uniref:phosphoribosyltransferase n=1 Tax=Cellulosimicrobium sp. CUA-896 TaxID=1517881 RepID=UPI0009F84EB0|nr:phosphoribosyltransferase [Cellulosimicrobium sp. CUA-896]
MTESSTNASPGTRPASPAPDGAGPAAVAPEREVLTWDAFGVAARELAEQVVASGFRPDVVVAVARGGLLPGGAVAYALGTKGVGTLNVEFYTDIGQTLADPKVLPPLMDTSDLPGAHVLVVDDVADSGRTLALVMEMLNEHGAEARSAVLYTKPRTIIQPDYSWRDTDLWITFPWSADPPVEAVTTPPVG